MAPPPDAGCAAIARVVVRYATRIHRRKWPRLRTCFTDDRLTMTGGEWRIAARRFTTVERRRFAPAAEVGTR